MPTIRVCLFPREICVALLEAFEAKELPEQLFHEITYNTFPEIAREISRNTVEQVAMGYEPPPEGTWYGVETEAMDELNTWREKNNLLAPFYFHTYTI